MSVLCSRQYFRDKDYGMLLTYLAIITPFLVLIRPLQRNRFFIIYFALMMISAYITETYYFKTLFFSNKTLLLFAVYHIVCINISTFLAYGADKKAAIGGDWRIPEAHLHALEFLGGWPGAYLAQKFFHHKNKKRSYQTMFWFMIVLQGILVFVILKYLNLIH